MTVGEKHSEKISFLGAEFDYGTIKFPYEEYIATIKESSKIRYKYYASKDSYTGTLYATLKDNTISEARFYNNNSIEETINDLESNWQLIVFWILWILLTGGCVAVFYSIENKWLEN